MPPTPPKTTRQRRVEAALPQLQTVQQIIDHIGVARWDLLLVGDGSGTGWQDGIGYAVGMVDRHSRTSKFLYGAMYPASINFAEQMPYLHALTWFHANGGRDLVKSMGQLHVPIVTDSQVIANHGTTASDPTQPLPTTQTFLWAQWRELLRYGYVCSFHWATRSSSLLNWACDLLASLNRSAGLGKEDRPITSDQLKQFRGLVRAAEHSQATGDTAAVMPQMIKAMKLLLQHAAPTPDRLAAALEQIKISDPATGQEITAEFLTQYASTRT